MTCNITYGWITSARSGETYAVQWDGAGRILALTGPVSYNEQLADDPADWITNDLDAAENAAWANEQEWQLQ